MKYRFISRLTACFYLSLTCASALADAKIVEAKNFGEIKSILSTIEEPQNTLAVFDDDDTLSMMPCEDDTHCQYLGTPAWFDWQRSLPSDSTERVATSFQGLISVSDVIIEKSDMTFTGPQEANVLQWMSDQQFHIMVETARGPSLQSATERQLEDLNILPLLTESGATSVEANRANHFENGIFYVTGQDKGQMLQTLLKDQGKHYQNIVLVDDSLENVENMAKAFENDPSVCVTAIHYTGLEAKRTLFSHMNQDVSPRIQSLIHWKALTA